MTMPEKRDLVMHNKKIEFLMLVDRFYEAPFKTKCHQCFRNLYRTSNIYIGSPIYISDVRYLYPTSRYLYPTSGYLYPTSGYLYPTSGYLYPTSGYLYPTSGYLYPTSDIYIGRPIYNTRLWLGQGLGIGIRFYPEGQKLVCTERRPAQLTTF